MQMTIHVQSKVIQIVSDKLGIDPVKIYDHSNFIDDLGADSLDVVDILMEIEKIFNISIPDEIGENLIDIRSLSSYIESKV